MPTYPVTGTVTGTGGETTLKSDELEFLDTEIIYYDVAPTTINVGTFTVPSPGGSYTFTINAPVLPNTTHWKHGGTLATINFLAPASAGTATFTVQPTKVDEGQEATFTVTTTDIEPGSSLGWRLVHVGGVSKNSHYDSGPNYGIVGSITLDNTTTPKGSFKVKPLVDGVTNPPGSKKEFKIQITKSGTVIATSNTIEVTEGSSIPGSLGPTFSLALSPSSVNEGSNVTGTITITNPSSKELLVNWVLRDISSPYDKDITRFFSPSGSVTIPANATTATFTIPVYEDNLTTPGKTFKVMLVDAFGFNLLATAAGPITVNDTSKTPGITTSGGALTASALSGTFVDYVYSGNGDVRMYIFPDGTARIGFGDLNWFTPTTTNIGSSYYIKIERTSFYEYGAGGEADEGIDFTQLNNMISLGVKSIPYACVDPESEVLVDSDGTTKLAADLEIGDEVYTMHEATKIWGYFKVIRHEIVTQPKLILTFTDGSTLIASKSHKVYLGKNTWKAIEQLTVGERLVTFSGTMKELLTIEDNGLGPVVSMEIENAHTYIADQIVSHNKGPSPNDPEASVYATYTISFYTDITASPVGTATINFSVESRDMNR